MKLIYFLINNPCEDPNILKVILFIRKILEIAFIIIPIVLIVLITFDFIKSVTAGNEDTMKKNQKIVIKRLVYSVMLFFVIPIVNIVFSAFGTSNNEDKISGTINNQKVSYLSCWDNAKDKKTIESFKITATFNPDGGKVYGDKIKICGGSISCEITVPNATKKGYTLKGWKQNNNSDIHQIGKKVTIKNNDFFTAIWEEKNNSNSPDISGGSSGATIDSSGFYVYELSNIKYYTIANAVDFHKYVNNNDFYQDANSSWYDSCLGFSFVYADAIKTKKFSIINNQSGLYNGNNASTDNNFSQKENANKNIILSTIYEELKKHNPVVVQVNGNVEGTSRHYSVIIGVKQNVNISNIQETDFLLLDVWDGKIEQMNGKGGSNAVDGDGSRFMITGTATGRTYGYQLYLLG